MCIYPTQRLLAVTKRGQDSAYDTRFLAVANSLGTRLVTEDVKLRTAASDLTQSIALVLATT